MTKRSLRLSESGRDRRALAADAGFGSLSIGSVLAGALVAYGAFAVLIGVAAAVVDALNVKTDIVSTDYEQLGIVGGLIVAGILLVSYLFGGYVAGRMARRAGLLNGLLVAVLGLVIAAGAAAIVRASNADTVTTSLRSLGVPTTADEYGQAFTVAGIASLAAILIGSLIGGSLGERWHGKLLARAVDPDIGTEADARRQAHADMARAEQERTLAFERARVTNPARARRSDRDAISAADRRVPAEDWDRAAASTLEEGRAIDEDRATADANGHGHNRANGQRVATGRAGDGDPAVSHGVVTDDSILGDTRGRPLVTENGTSARGTMSSRRRRLRRRSSRVDH